MENKIKILLVEDETALIEVLKDKMENAGFEVEVAKNGVEGLEKACKPGISLILLDIVMPKMDGMTMLRSLRKEKGVKTPVIVLTNLGSDDDAKSALADGADDFMIKAEHKLDEVIEKINKFVKD